jgi:uncharacterized membrane protein
MEPLEKCYKDVVNAVTTDHPAKPYLILGGMVGALGLVKNSISGLILLGLGGALVARGFEEMRKIEELHDGNHHGVNAPPQNA